MKKLVPIGIGLLVLGAICFLLSGVEFKQREEVFRVGNLSATATTSRKITNFRYVGAGCLGAGAVLLLLRFFQRG